jgi:Skp family chaperone for outer membrane proteins
MDIKELKKSKNKAEKEIQEATSSIIEKFKNETGLSVDFIGINMIDATTAGDEQRQFIVGRVSIGVKL